MMGPRAAPLPLAALLVVAAAVVLPASAAPAAPGSRAWLAEPLGRGGGGSVGGDKGKDCYNERMEARCNAQPNCVWCRNKWSISKGNDGVCAALDKTSELNPWAYECAHKHKPEPDPKPDPGPPAPGPDPVAPDPEPAPGPGPGLAPWGPPGGGGGGGAEGRVAGAPGAGGGGGDSAAAVAAAAVGVLRGGDDPCAKTRMEAACNELPTCVWCKNKWSTSKGNEGVCCSVDKTAGLNPWAYDCAHKDPPTAAGAA